MSTTTKLYAALGAALLLIGSHWYTYNAGDRNGTNAILVGTLQASNKALNDRISENAAESLRLNDAAQKASKDHANEIKRVRDTAAANAGKRVPIDPRICQPARQAESAEAGSDGQGTTAAAFLPVEFTDSLSNAFAKADEITAGLRTLIRRADEAGCFQ